MKHSFFHPCHTVTHPHTRGSALQRDPHTELHLRLSIAVETNKRLETSEGHSIPPYLGVETTRGLLRGELEIIEPVLRGACAELCLGDVDYTTRLDSSET